MNRDRSARSLRVVVYAIGLSRLLCPTSTGANSENLTGFLPVLPR